MRREKLTASICGSGYLNPVLALVGISGKLGTKTNVELSVTLYLVLYFILKRKRNSSYLKLIASKFYTEVCIVAPHAVTVRGGTCYV